MLGTLGYLKKQSSDQLEKEHHKYQGLEKTYKPRLDSQSATTSPQVIIGPVKPKRKIAVITTDTNLEQTFGTPSKSNERLIPKRPPRNAALRMDPTLLLTRHAVAPLYLSPNTMKNAPLARPPPRQSVEMEEQRKQRIIAQTLARMQLSMPNIQNSPALPAPPKRPNRLPASTRAGGEPPSENSSIAKDDDFNVVVDELKGIYASSIQVEKKITASTSQSNTPIINVVPPSVIHTDLTPGIVFSSPEKPKVNPTMIPPESVQRTSPPIPILQTSHPRVNPTIPTRENNPGVSDVPVFNQDSFASPSLGNPQSNLKPSPISPIPQPSLSAISQSVNKTTVSQNSLSSSSSSSIPIKIVPNTQKIGNKSSQVKKTVSSTTKNESIKHNLSTSSPQLSTPLPKSSIPKTTPSSSTSSSSSSFIPKQEEEMLSDFEEDNEMIFTPPVQVLPPTIPPPRPPPRLHPSHSNLTISNKSRADAERRMAKKCETLLETNQFFALFNLCDEWKTLNPMGAWEAFLFAGKAHLLRGEISQAEQNFKNCVSLGGNASLELSKLAKFQTCREFCLQELGRRTPETTNLTMAYAKKMCSTCPFSPQLYILKAAITLTSQEGDFKQDVKKAMELAQDVKIQISRPTAQYARVLHRLGLFLEADQLLDEVCSKLMKNDVCHTLLALFRQMENIKQDANEAYVLQKWDEAIRINTFALSLDSTNDLYNTMIYSNRAACRMQLLEYGLAVEDCDMALKLTPTFVRARLRRARSLLKLNKFRESIADFDLAWRENSLPSIGEELAEARKLYKLFQEQRFGGGNKSSSPPHHREIPSIKPIPKVDLYQVLGINPQATSTDIKKAYHRAALKHHPDKNVGDDMAAQRFKGVLEAFHTLKDPLARKKYDKTYTSLGVHMM